MLNVNVTLFVAIFLLSTIVVVRSTIDIRSGDESKRFFNRLDESSRQFRFALCALTTSRSLINWKWLHQLHKHGIAVYILEDKDENQLHVKSNITFLSIESEMTRSNGYSNANLVPRTVWAWDKALFYFTKVSLSYEFVWFIEYDVYVPSLKAFLDVHKTAMHDRSDLVVKDNIEVDSSWGHSNLRVARLHIDRPWYHSLVCAAGLSRRLLSDVLEYTSTNHQLDFIEVLFNTIRHHKKYNLYRPHQFQTIQFHDKGHINCKDATTHSDMWYHPIKTQTKFLSDCNLTDSPSN
jgi:hypothetical protein